MFERYTERARRVIFFARYEASQFGSLTIETEHLLIALLREDRNLLNRFLDRVSSPDAVRTLIEGRLTIRVHASNSGETALKIGAVKQKQLDERPDVVFPNSRDGLIELRLL